MKLVFLLLFLCIFGSVNAQLGHIQGKIIDEQLQNAVGASVVNLSTHVKVSANRDGLYSINTSIGDTLYYRLIGLTDEKRVVENDYSHINVVLINKTVNDLGAVWSQRMWEKANQQMTRRYQKIEKEAQKLGIWNY